MSQISPFTGVSVPLWILPTVEKDYISLYCDSPFGEAIHKCTFWKSGVDMIHSSTTKPAHQRIVLEKTGRCELRIDDLKQGDIGEWFCSLLYSNTRNPNESVNKQLVGNGSVILERKSMHI